VPNITRYSLLFCFIAPPASSSSLNYNYFLGGDYDISWEKRPFKVGDLCDDFATYENYDLSEQDFDQVRLLKKR